ncbi:MAG TPA: glycine betaine ABC transporter substrate-binding protein [Bacillota bacterium]|jgi:osmoprotectant transport system substrate-binding protein|nr:glycine/betaine ABC transporter substrate-binding protein [Fastidiosipila sp.]HPX92574.1 glycine betaine ABC transporter substrate-binding protein [Bacillota bacterium]HQB81158.1 glycine betaine ABC transporter substrate-binding protein [Bacillota bacterium]
MKKLFSLFAVIILTLAIIGGCAGSKEGSDKPIIIYDGEFSEMQIIHQMVKMLVEEHTEASVEIRDQMSPVNSYRSLVKGESDLMNSYDGTLLTTYLKKDVSDVPQGQSLYEYANQVAMERDGTRLLKPLGHENTYAVGVTQELADQYGLESISDLVEVAPLLAFGAEHEFFSEEGSMKYGPFVAFYGLDFKDSKAIEMALKYSAVESGNLDVTIVYSTDGMNKKVGLKVLEDDQDFFAEYNDALLVRDDLFERYREEAPDLEDVLNLLAGQFTNESMTDLTYEIDVNGKTPEEVAKDFLTNQGLIDA